MRNEGGGRRGRREEGSGKDMASVRFETFEGIIAPPFGPSDENGRIIEGDLVNLVDYLLER
jgi:hypothetical protein